MKSRIISPDESQMEYASLSGVQGSIVLVTPRQEPSRDAAMKSNGILEQVMKKKTGSIT